MHVSYLTLETKPTLQYARECFFTDPHCCGFCTRPCVCTCVQHRTTCTAGSWSSQRAHGHVSLEIGLVCTFCGSCTPIDFHVRAAACPIETYSLLIDPTDYRCLVSTFQNCWTGLKIRCWPGALHQRPWRYHMISANGLLLHNMYILYIRLLPKMTTHVSYYIWLHFILSALNFLG